MPIEGVAQPDQIGIGKGLRLRKYDGAFDFAYAWYQDGEMIYLVDGVRAPYSWENLKRMYTYLDQHGELYFIEALQGGHYVPIGDVTFWKDDMPIVIGDPAFRGKGIGYCVITALIRRAMELGYTTLHVAEIYDFNEGSKKCFEKAGFHACEKTEKGSRYVLELKDYCDVGPEKPGFLRKEPKEARPRGDVADPSEG